MSFKLGKKPGVVIDPRTFKLANLFQTTQLPIAPKASQFSKGATWPMFANDQYGDCTCASTGHRILLQERNSGQHETQITDQDVLEVYSAVTGFDSRTGANDNGAYLLDVLNYMRKVGMGLEHDGTHHTIYAFAKLDHTRTDEVRLGAWLFGGLYTGVMLPESAQSEPYDWHTTTGKPGGWGGHAITVNGYDDRYVYFITWGRQARMSWAFWGKYVDEAYVVFSEDFLNSRDATRAGFNHDQLQAWLKEL